MKNIKISFFIDALFIFTATFFVFYAIVKSLVKSVFLSTVITIFICLLVSGLYTAFSIYKHGKKAILSNNEKEFKAFEKTLALLSDASALSLLKSLYEKRGEEVVKQGKKLKIKGKKEEVYFDFSPCSASLKTVINAYKKTPANYTTTFIAKDFDVSALSYFNGLEKRVKLITLSELYNALKKEKLLPEITHSEPKKKTLKELIEPSLKRENAVKFLIWGGVLILFSTVTYFGGVYLFLGCALIIFALFLRFFARKSPKKQSAI
ncbi:MAG: hypothetical protein IKL82_01295 [Clostridia bacterium]|nr:hypothetical protein [Clostridia bacterium]